MNRRLFMVIPLLVLLLGGVASAGASSQVGFSVDCTGAYGFGQVPDDVAQYDWFVRLWDPGVNSGTGFVTDHFRQGYVEAGDQFNPVVVWPITPSEGTSFDDSYYWVDIYDFGNSARPHVYSDEGHFDCDEPVPTDTPLPPTPTDTPPPPTPTDTPTPIIPTDTPLPPTPTATPTFAGPTDTPPPPTPTNTPTPIIPTDTPTPTNTPTPIIPTDTPTPTNTPTPIIPTDTPTPTNTPTPIIPTDTPTPTNTPTPIIPTPTHTPTW